MFLDEELPFLKLNLMNAYDIAVSLPTAYLGCIWWKDMSNLKRLR